MTSMTRERHRIPARLEAIAREMFDKKVEDLEECELREVWEVEELFDADGRAGPLGHGRLAGRTAAVRLIP
jgi:hypothetical protein